MFIWNLSENEKLTYYKRIKSALIEADCFTFENLCEALNNKIADLQGLI